MEGVNAIDEELEVRSFCDEIGWNRQKLLSRISEEMTEYIIDSIKPPSSDLINDIT